MPWGPSPIHGGPSADPNVIGPPRPAINDASASGVVEGVPPSVSERVSRPVTVDLEALASGSILLPVGPRTNLVDEFRVIKRPLIANVQRPDGGSTKRSNLVLVTSALPGEGKTFTSINLAMSISTERNCHVLLVDCDPSRPATLARLGLPESQGLLDRLQDPSRDLSEFLLKPTNIERLTLLPVGTPSSYATELLASDTMDSLLEEISQRYVDRIVIFDAPPLLPSTESQVLGSRVGQIVFVVTADRTPLAAIKQALLKIESCPIVLPVLNKCRAYPGALSYGYGYGYGHSSA